MITKEKQILTMNRIYVQWHSNTKIQCLEHTKDLEVMKRRRNQDLEYCEFETIRTSQITS